MRFGFIGFGEVAATFSTTLLEKGAEVVAFDIATDRLRGTEVPFRLLPELCVEAEYVLSTVTTQAARAVAADTAVHLKPGQTYVDLNSTSPAAKVEIAAVIEPSGAAFAEGAILGAVGATGAATRILCGGPHGRQAAETLSAHGLRASFYSPEVGKASMFKMLRSIFSKGLEALILELLIAGKRAGIEADLWQDVCGFMNENQFDYVAENWLRTHATACERRFHEMVQVADTMREIGVDPVMTAATEAFFGRSRRLRLHQSFPEKPESMDAVVSCIEQRLDAEARRG